MCAPVNEWEGYNLVKKIFAFYDILLYIAICIPLLACSAYLFVYLFVANELALFQWWLVVLFAIGIVIPVIGIFSVRWCCVTEHDSAYFHYSMLTVNWEKAANSIDVRWNTEMHPSEIRDIELTSLTKEEVKQYTSRKHLVNRYLKINMNYGRPKYVHVGGYSKKQIDKIIGALCQS